MAKPAKKKLVLERIKSLRSSEGACFSFSQHRQTLKTRDGDQSRVELELENEDNDRRGDDHHQPKREEHELGLGIVRENRASHQKKQQKIFETLEPASDLFSLGWRAADPIEALAQAQQNEYQNEDQAGSTHCRARHAGLLFGRPALDRLHGEAHRVGEIAEGNCERK